MERPDGSRRLRDKNQIKKLKDRPPHLQPSWQPKDTVPVTDYSLNEIEGIITGAGDVGNENVAGRDNDHALFDISEADEVRMNALIEAAINEQAETSDEPVHRPGMRSSGIQLDWNPVMNSDNIVITK